SSRRRHTRSKRDWSSDVCSSDLGRQELCSRFLFQVSIFESYWSFTTTNVSFGINHLRNANFVSPCLGYSYKWGIHLTQVTTTGRVAGHGRLSAHAGGLRKALPIGGGLP